MESLHRVFSKPFSELIGHSVHRLAQPYVHG